MSSRKRRARSFAKDVSRKTSFAVYQPCSLEARLQAFKVLFHLCETLSPLESTAGSIYAECQRLGLSLSAAGQAIELLLNRHLIEFTSPSGRVAPTEAALHLINEMRHAPERECPPFGALATISPGLVSRSFDEALHFVGLRLLHCAYDLRDPAEPVPVEVLLDQLESWIDYTRPPSKVLIPPLTELYDVLSGQYEQNIGLVSCR